MNPSIRVKTSDEARCDKVIIWLVRNVNRMMLILILSGLLTIQAGVIEGEICDGIPVNGVCHKQEILHENLDQPALLTVDQKSNILYFRNFLPKFGYTTARLNLDTKEFKNIEGVNYAYAHAVDRNSQDVYIGGNGLYKYDAVDDKATYIGAEHDLIWRMYYKDVLYYYSRPKQSLYTFENGVSKKYPYLEDTKVDEFFIDDGFIHFTNATGLYSQKKGTKDTVLYNSPYIGLKGFALDTKGMVHICMQDGVYVVKKDSLTVEKIIDLDNAYGCAFDKNNNIVYSDATKLLSFGLFDVNKMKLILILSGLLTIQAIVNKGEICDGITVNGVCHKQEILIENLDRPALLTVDLKSNILYFRHKIHLLSTTARLNLGTKEFKNIEGVIYGYTQAVDRNSHDVYIGGSNSLYKYNAVDDKATFIGAKGANILRVCYKDVLYYSLYPTKYLYTFENGVSKKYPDLEDTKVNEFFIDDGFIYFTNATGLYSQKKGTKDTVLYNSPYIGLKGFALDTKGMVHICMQDGVYVVKKDSLTVEKIIDLDNAYGCAFDKNNNIVYSDATKLVRLLPVPVKKLHVM
ncbi:hypothetical protein K1T71_013989 [Dendrolimus kikuchii]|uniref:Uncharacterized protein n=1 Tax=Dendrolimus kikuchii TaxID=765133 RepID=A0ACC1CGA7_9NEOP|nr:hypothetical protein K1T71_013989 [Dendrolimus kikuchii]